LSIEQTDVSNPEAEQKPNSRKVFEEVSVQRESLLLGREPGKDRKKREPRAEYPARGTAIEGRESTLLRRLEKKSRLKTAVNLENLLVEEMKSSSGEKERRDPNVCSEGRERVFFS